MAPRFQLLLAMNFSNRIIRQFTRLVARRLMHPASSRSPGEMRTTHTVAMVGKGVCFDSGGLDIKTAAGMKLMKKDMGGAAHVLGIADVIMSLGLKLHLKVLVPAVENAIAGNAMRPLDVVHTRAGITVEIGNTDAEGRVILSDALQRASEADPELILDFATLTGAARVALGTELLPCSATMMIWQGRYFQQESKKQTRSGVYHFGPVIKK